MREIIARAAEAVRRGGASPAERQARAFIAAAMAEEDRLLDEAEVEEIAAEMAPEPEPRVEDDPFTGQSYAEMTERAWDALPEHQKAVTASGERLYIKGGRAVRAELSEGGAEWQALARAVRADMEGAVLEKGIEDGTSYDAASLAEPLDPEFGARCPECGSANADPVWYDERAAVCHCHDCGAEFDQTLVPEETPIEELTMEDVDLGGDMFGTVYHDGDTFRWELWDDAEFVGGDAAETAEEAFGTLDEIAGLAPEEGEVLLSTEDGTEIEVEEVRDGEVVTAKGTARAARLAYQTWLGRFLPRRSGVWTAAVFREGDRWASESGGEVVVIEGGDEPVVEEAELDGLSRAAVLSMPAAKLAQYLEDHGYSPSERL